MQVILLLLIIIWYYIKEEGRTRIRNADWKDSIFLWCSFSLLNFGPFIRFVSSAGVSEASEASKQQSRWLPETGHLLHPPLWLGTSRLRQVEDVDDRRRKKKRKKRRVLIVAIEDLNWQCKRGERGQRGSRTPTLPLLSWNHQRRPGTLTTSTALGLAFCLTRLITRKFPLSGRRCSWRGSLCSQSFAAGFVSTRLVVSQSLPVQGLNPDHLPSAVTKKPCRHRGSLLSATARRSGPSAASTPASRTFL